MKKRDERMTEATQTPKTRRVYGQIELAERLGIPAGTLRQWMKRGKLPPADETVSNRPMWYAATIDAWLGETE
jgi:predicted DNA-binding transcriptional regulator AlpA